PSAGVEARAIANPSSPQAIGGHEQLPSILVAIACGVFHVCPGNRATTIGTRDLLPPAVSRSAHRPSITWWAVYVRSTMGENNSALPRNKRNSSADKSLVP